MGKFEDWKYKEYQKPLSNHCFDLENTGKELNKEEAKKVEKLLRKREKLLEQYKKICSKLDPLLCMKRETLEELQETNQTLCQIEGHRLSMELGEYYDYESYYYLTCLICGEKIYESELTPNDIVVDEDMDNLQRVKIKLKNKS